jgi:predicted RNase H-like HicB family nuclease
MPKAPRQFRAIIERDEDGYYVGSVPALPGCHTQAKTMEELRTRLRAAVGLCLEVAAENKKYREQIKDFAYEPSFVGMETVQV